MTCSWKHTQLFRNNSGFDSTSSISGCPDSISCDDYFWRPLEMYSWRFEWVMCSESVRRRSVSYTVHIYNLKITDSVYCEQGQWSDHRIWTMKAVTQTPTVPACACIHSRSRVWWHCTSGMHDWAINHRPQHKYIRTQNRGAGCISNHLIVKAQAAYSLVGGTRPQVAKKAAQCFLAHMVIKYMIYGLNSSTGFLEK